MGERDTSTRWRRGSRGRNGRSLRIMKRIPFLMPLLTDYVVQWAPVLAPLIMQPLSRICDIMQFTRLANVLSHRQETPYDTALCRRTTDIGPDQGE
ncbi:hypothetical protein BDV93DRAFT_527538 [Ceratobasidium sp. AG-I]|nr:hypothetical protein BDV93DRAFT_527538 [Ceratobasidium sp. AG-I]